MITHSEKPFNLDRKERDAICETHGSYTDKGFAINDSKTHWSGCEACKQIERDKDEEKQLMRKRLEDQERIERRLNKAGIPLRFRDRTIENYIADTPEKKSSLTIARDFIENFDENHKSGMTLIFSGKAGTGSLPHGFLHSS